MKKILIIIALLIFRTSFTIAQNVGIDNPNPTEKLSVNGNILLPNLGSLFVGGNTTLGNDGSRFHHSGGNTYIDNKGTGGIYFRADNLLGATNRMLLSSMGNLGIGDMNPGQRLSVNGNISLTGLVLIEAPQVPTLLNNWVAGSPGGGRGPRYLKDKQGMVHIYGVVSNEFGSSNTVIFTLPVGYRPSGTIIMNQAGGGPNNQSGVARLEIRSNGEVRIVANALQWISLDNISFFTY